MTYSSCFVFVCLYWGSFLFHHRLDFHLFILFINNIMNFTGFSRNSTETSHELLLTRIDDDDLPGRRKITRRISIGGRTITDTTPSTLVTSNRRSLIGRSRTPSNTLTSCLSQGNEESPMMFRHQHIMHSTYGTSRDLSNNSATEKEVKNTVDVDSNSFSRKRSKQQAIVIIENVLACLDDLDI